MYHNAPVKDVKPR